MNPNVIVKGLVENVETDMLINTGFAVTIIHKTIWDLILPTVKPKLKPATFPIVTDICGEAALQIQIGESTSQQNVLIAKDVTQKCLLGTDLLWKQNCIIIPRAVLYAELWLLRRQKFRLAIKFT